VECEWAAKFGVGQASIQEAINILAQEGFVTKAPSYSARVIHVNEIDVSRIYHYRGAIEGLASCFAAQFRQDINAMQAAMDIMRSSARTGDDEVLIDSDLHFNLALCKLSHNPNLIGKARRILVPLFAFVRMRVSASGQSTSTWGNDPEVHQRITDLIREGEGEVAEQYVKKAMERYANTAYEHWEKREEHAR
jgi:DNA-binding GntR family transcriptional regulator